MNKSLINSDLSMMILQESDEDKKELTYLQILHLIEGDDSSLFYFPGVEVNWSSFCSYVAINIIAHLSPSNKYDINDNIQIKISQVDSLHSLMEKQKKELQHETLHSTAEVTIEDTDLQYLKDIILLKLQ